MELRLGVAPSASALPKPCYAILTYEAKVEVDSGNAPDSLGL